MAITAVRRKSLTDLTRRKARAFFTILTLAIAVASVGIFAVPSLLQQAMDRKIASTRLADLTVTFDPLVINDTQLRAVARTPNVVAVQPKSVFSTRIYVGDRRQKAVIIGVPSYDRQDVDVITVKSGLAPATGTLLTDNQNANKHKFGGGRGDTVRIIGAGAKARPIPITGKGQYLGGGQLVAADGFAVFYGTAPTVAALSGTPGYTMLAMRLRDTSRATARRTARAVETRLQAVPGFSGYADYPEIRTRGDYPGKELFGQVTGIMTLVTFLALLSALVLVSNTMTTLIGEQTGEIAAMKAIGATRRQIGRIYRRTALLLGALGALAGAALGVLLANGVVSFFGSRFYGIESGFQVDGTILAISLALGLLAPALAALPATRRAARLPLHEALSASGSAVGGQGRLDRLARTVGFLPRPAQIGLRGAVRRKRRTLATAVQISLAVGMLLAALSLGKSVGNMTTGFYDNLHFDVWAQTYASKPFKATAPDTIKSVDGVRAVQPVLSNNARVAGKNAQLWGVVERAWYMPEITSGHWYTSAQARANAPVTVVGRALADKAHVGLGDQIVADTAAGRRPFRVIGITTSLLNQGAVAYMPIGTLQSALGTPGEINNYWIRTTSTDHGAIDRITNRVEDALAASGNQVTTMERYVQQRDNVQANASLTGSVTVLGLIIVLISLVGLVNAITMGVIERTREIGVLRCVGARAKDVRRIFRSEGVAVAIIGWLVGIPLGWAMAHGLISATASIVSTELSFRFPIANVAITLVGTILLALLVLIAPLRRAVHLKTGDALRYT
jgi:putative ABC transport system permease protein